MSERKELATALDKVDLETISRLSEFRVQSTDKAGGMSYRRLDLAICMIIVLAAAPRMEFSGICGKRVV